MTERTEAAADEIESQRETIRSLHTALDDLTRAGLEMERAKNEEIAVLREALRRARNRLVVGDYSEDDTNRYEEMAAFDSLIGCDTGGYNPREIETGLASIRKAAGVERDCAAEEEAGND